MQFRRGTYGEILLAPLVADLSAAEVLQKMVGEELYKKMASNERETLYDEAIHSFHRQNLRRALSGEVTDDPRAMDLYRAVMRGEPLNLYPVGLKKQSFKSFVPILRRIGDEQWQLGLPKAGRHTILTGAMGPTLRQVWHLYMEWMEAEAADDEA